MIDFATLLYGIILSHELPKPPIRVTVQKVSLLLQLTIRCAILFIRQNCKG